MGNIRILAVLMALLALNASAIDSLTEAQRKEQKAQEKAAREAAKAAKKAAELERKRAVRKEGMVNIDGKLYPAAPDWITEAYCLVDGKQVPARLVRTKCDNGQCKLYVIKDERGPARD